MSVEKNQDTEPIKILIVEDDRNLQQLMAKFISNEITCKILKAKNGLEALTMLLQDSPKPDFIILDIKLPFLNGEELLRIIRYRPEFDNVPIVVCTAVDNLEEAKEIIKHKIDGYVLKPINRVTFLEQIVPLLKANNKVHPNFVR